MILVAKYRSQSSDWTEILSGRWIRRLYPLTLFAVSFMCLLLLFDISSQHVRELPAETLAFDFGEFRPIYSIPRSSYPQDDQALNENEENRLLDMNDFRFLKNSSGTCQANDPVNLIAFVHTSLANFRRREIIRKTWASREPAQEVKLKIVFLVGLTGDRLIQQQVDDESAQYEDIVQGNFLDSYRNLTYKHLMGYKWVLKFCPTAKFVMKVDDDAFVDIYRVVYVLNELSNEKSRTSRQFRRGEKFANSVHYSSMETTRSRLTNSQPRNLLSCSVFPEGIKVKRYGKWRLTIEDYPFETFPSYCSGIAYFLTPDVLKDLYRASKIVRPFLWIDDLFITGILAAQFPIHKHPLNFKFTYSPRDLYNWLKIKQLSPSPHMIGDIGDVDDWESLMLQLWDKTRRVWES